MDISDTLLMSNKYLISLAKAIDSLIDSIDCFKITEFLKFWYSLDKYVEELFVFLNLSSFKNFGSVKFTRKDALKLAQLSKKTKGLDDLIVAIEI